LLKVAAELHGRRKGAARLWPPTLWREAQISSAFHGQLICAARFVRRQQDAAAPLRIFSVEAFLLAIGVTRKQRP
jgi:endonuclease III